jgi:hypothetical protein
MKSWDRPKSYTLIRELGRLGRYDSTGALPDEECLLETREKGFGLGTGGMIDGLELTDSPVLGWCFTNDSLTC